MEKANYPCDLHCHSNRSDGNQPPQEVIRHAVERGVKVLALTDHDIRPPETIYAEGKKTDIVKYAAAQGLHLIRGIEVSCETNIDDVHIVAFGCDWKIPFFEELEDFTIRSKIDGYKKLVQILRKKGMDLCWEEILEEKNPPMKDEQIQKKHIFEMIAKKGYAKTWKEAKLMVKNSGELNVRREKPNAVEVISRIHEAGGIAILAHPYLINERMVIEGKRIERSEFIQLLFEHGLDGIEARYTYDKTSYDGTMTKEEICREVIELYSQPGRIISGGSDYHADGGKGGTEQREIGECGITLEEFYRHSILSKV